MTYFVTRIPGNRPGFDMSPFTPLAGPVKGKTAALFMKGRACAECKDCPMLNPKQPDATNLMPAIDTS